MPKIFINPGHCVGIDPGACAFGLHEADIALRICRRIEGYLQAAGYTVKLFYFDGLQQICDDANAFDADLFVSVHCNSFNGAAKGSETLFSGSNDSRKLAVSIQNQIVNKLHTVDRGIKLSGVYVLKYTNMPAVLVETAFIDNADDVKLLIDREDDFARAIAVGISDYFAPSKSLPDTVDLPPSNKFLSEHFSVDEFACHHCGKCIVIHPRLLELLEQLRKNIGGFPLHINSGYRCPTHNAAVGGVPDSQHVKGTAADVAVPRQMFFNDFLWHVQQLPFDWVGIYRQSNFIHVDVRDGGIFYHQGEEMD